MKNITKSKIFIFLLIISLSIIPINAVVDEFWACFDKGQTIKYCNPNININMCGNPNGCLCSDFPGCERCMDLYNETGECYSSGNYNNCMESIPRVCSAFGGGEINQTPSELTINSPENGEKYIERYALLDLTADQLSDIYYTDNNFGRGIWTRVCSDCASYSRNRAFREGLNDITVRAKNKFGIYSYKNFSFYIDSKAPKITKVLPKSRFANGTFSIEFKEENPEEVKINYGNLITGYNELGIEIDSCSYYRGKYTCRLEDLDLSQYDGQQIEYWADVEDIVEHKVSSRPVLLNVDTTLPVINNQIIYQIYGRYVAFSLDITEINFKDVQYIDYSASSPRWQSLCTSLRAGICTSKKSFTAGPHIIDIKVADKAGNKIIERVEFTI